MKFLSLAARIAIAIHLFRGYCDRRALNHPEIDRFVDHLWMFLALPADGAFEPWVKCQPPLTSAGLGDEFPPGLDLVLKVARVSEAEFRQVLGCTTEVLYSSLYAAADEEGSRQYLLELASIAESVGAKWPDLACFSGSKWSDGKGWGQRPSEQELSEWHLASRG